MRSDKVRLFLASFLILYFELVLIRFIPAQIRYVGFFSNIILLASFVGIGLGTLFWKQIRVPIKSIPFIILAFQILGGILKYDLIVTSNQIIYFNAGFGALAGEPVFLLPLIFFVVVTLFLLPAKIVGQLFSKLPPLTAYKIDILGSITGVVAFTLTSFFGGGPQIWFPVVLILSLLLTQSVRKKSRIFLFIGIVAFSFLFELQGSRTFLAQHEVLWSPYYKVTLYTVGGNRADEDGVLTINVNNIGHQVLVDPDGPDGEFFYQFPYKITDRKFKNVLVIGSGGGNDVAKALKQGAEKVVAVEIDPAIIRLGKKYHPLKPYDSARVQIINDDGRSYLQNSREKFDLIIFALTHSLTLTSASSSLRLESYLFTRESLQSARKLLRDNGLLVMYNYYRDQWLIEKISLLLEDVFGKAIIFVQDTRFGPAATYISPKSPGALTIKNDNRKETHFRIPTDDWPFLYLKNPSIPRLYWSYLGVISVLVLLLLMTLLRKTKIPFNTTMFFLGAAFMLLETKNIVQFSLLFGSTWFTNAAVFVGLLSMVLLAIGVAQKFPKIPIRWLYILLFFLIAFNYFFPQRFLLILPFMPRLLLAILINFSPVFIANVIFALLFRKEKTPAGAFGSNILGIFVGGIFEYTSLLWGYNNLMLFIAAFYFFAVVSIRSSLLKK